MKIDLKHYILMFVLLLFQVHSCFSQEVKLSDIKVRDGYVTDGYRKIKVIIIHPINWTVT
jgi:hypothetical protein